MRIHLQALFVLTSACLLLGACGGGGGGNGDGGFTLADIVGSWQGPTGNVTVEGELFLAAGPTGIVVDAAGNAVGAGASNREGTVSLTSAADGIYRFVGTGTSAGQVAMLIMSADRDHLLWIANSLLLGAWERDASTFAGPYANDDVRDETWVGLAAEATAAMTPLDPETISVDIDADGNFTAGTSATNIHPVSVTDVIKGAYAGDYLDPAPPAEDGVLVVLITPDRRFVAIFSCLTGGTFPADCSYAALSR